MLLLSLYVTKNKADFMTLISILWHQLLLNVCLTLSPVILLNYKKSIGLPKQLQFLVDQKLRLFGEYLYSNSKATFETLAQMFPCEFCENLRNLLCEKSTNGWFCILSGEYKPWKEFSWMWLISQSFDWIMHCFLSEKSL